MRYLSYPLLCFALALVSGCAQKQTAETPARAFIARENMDTTIAPGDDFFTYVHGTWIKKTEIPGTEGSVGSFVDIYNTTKANLRNILEQAAKANAKQGTIEQQVGDMYTSGMDTVAIEKLGKAPLEPYLAKIAALTTPVAALQYDASVAKDGFNELTAADISVDDKRSSQYVVALYQTGLGLPDRDYYFNTDPATLGIVAAYKQYTKTNFTLLGEDPATAAKNAELVYALEKEIAASHRTKVERRNPELNYNKMAVADAAKKWANLDFATLLKSFGVQPDSVNVCQPDFYTKLNTLVKTVPLTTWQAYLRHNLTKNASKYLSKDFVDATFNYAKTLSGQTEMRPRWERVYRVTDGLLGDPLSQLYVQKHFTPEAKTRMDALVANLATAFEKRIEMLTWMSDSTKTEAKAKLSTIIRKIGYPETWRDFTQVVVTKDNYLNNAVACTEANFAFMLSHQGKPVDKKEWGLTASTINAYYNPTINEIVFPAGILQFPMFDLQADDAINYGAIGLVIGHEITHGFDDQGAQYNKEGNLKNWWGKSDKEKFKAKGEKVVKQYNAYTVLDTMHVNGALTLGENMADVGGLAIAYDAFKLTAQGQSTEKIDGFTPDQRFFLGFAGAWKDKKRVESQRQQVLTDPHSPAQYRVNGPLSNFTPFYTAFNVKEGQKLWKPESERETIW